VSVVNSGRADDRGDPAGGSDVPVSGEGDVDVPRCIFGPVSVDEPADEFVSVRAR